MKMKKAEIFLTGVLLVAGLTACGTSGSASFADSQSGATKQAAQVDADAGASIKGAAVQEKENTGTSRIAIVYFSEPETESPASVQGATQYIAQTIQERTCGDLFRITPKESYPIQHTALVAQAKVEVTAGARPAVQPVNADWSKYDTIFIGYPIWWGDLPRPVYTFLESQDFSGKHIVLFSTHGGSGLAGTVETITTKEGNANVNPNAFTVSRNEVMQAGPAAVSWLHSIGF